MHAQPTFPARMHVTIHAGAAPCRPGRPSARARVAGAGDSGQLASCEAAAYAIFIPEREQYQVYVEINEGSYGGRLGRDGMDSVDCLVANTRNNPIEELESHYKIRTERYELRDEPAAPGEWRGGIGIVRENRFLADGFVSLQGDRHLEAPLGIFGGADGQRWYDDQESRAHRRRKRCPPSSPACR